MELLKKLSVLSDAAKYDVSCSSSGSNRKNAQKGIGNAEAAGICHTWSSDGRCISLLKILFTNFCVYDCAYCVNRISNDVKRASFTPRELCELTIGFYRRNYIEGLFLSSAVIKSPNYTMALILQTIKMLRLEYHFNGYIHIKAIPGADSTIIHATGLYADRISVNMELPSEDSLAMLAPQKNMNNILTPMKYISDTIRETKALTTYTGKKEVFTPAGQTTQLIVGATPDSDFKMLKLSERIYNQFKLKRVYYSAYIAVNEHPNLPALTNMPPLLREHRLYQADWLLRFYKFKADELLTINNSNFDVDLDPKCDWALRNLDMFPVEINKADYAVLLRVPGIGVNSALKIVKARKFGSLTFTDLKKFRIVLKRAKHFICCNGKYIGDSKFEPKSIKNTILGVKDTPSKNHQLTIEEYLQGMEEERL